MSKIEWTEETWNPIIGCSHISPGCENCYAARQAHRGLSPAHRGLTTSGMFYGYRWNGEVRLLPERINIPIHWRKPRRIFVCSMSDLFHEKVPYQFITEIFDVMASTPHIYQILTKRPERMKLAIQKWIPFYAGEILPGDSALSQAIEFFRWPLENVWVGATIENRWAMRERITDLIKTPAVLRYLSMEPLLQPISFPTAVADSIDWAIVGGESGPKARACNIRWIRSLVAQCHSLDIPVFVKQLGSNPVSDEDGRLRLMSRKGNDPSEWPRGLRVREMPEMPRLKGE